MTPASSVLLLTTLTGFGYGLLAWLGVFALFEGLPDARWLVPAGVLVALAVASAGLIASVAHLGRPERAWRSFSQWRSSWLSREGIASLTVYPPAIGFAIAWGLAGEAATVTRILGILAAIAAIVTVGCTAMIYASLKPIRQWNNRFVLPNYLLFALFSGAALFAAIVAIAGYGVRPAASILVAGAIIALGAKLAYWWEIDRQSPLVSLAEAIGVSGMGEARDLDHPHFTENYILREMGFEIARKHAARLRRIAGAVGCVPVPNAPVVGRKALEGDSGVANRVMVVGEHLAGVPQGSRLTSHCIEIVREDDLVSRLARAAAGSLIPPGEGGSARLDGERALDMFASEGHCLHYISLPRSRRADAAPDGGRAALYSCFAFLGAFWMTGH